MYNPRKPADAQPFSRRGEAVFEGELAVLGLGEVLQMLCVGRQRLWLDVWTGEERQGSLVVADGEILGCATMGYGGDEAFFALSALRRGKFRVHAATAEDLVALPLTQRGWQELLLESVRLQDESERQDEVEAQRHEEERQRVQAKLASWRPPESGVLIPFPGRSSGAVAEVGAETSPLPTFPPAPPPARPPAPTQPEATVLAAEAPPTTPTPRAAPPAAQQATPSEPPPAELLAADRLLKEATEAYLKRDYGEALRLFNECLVLRPGDRKILHNIERLKKRGK